MVVQGNCNGCKTPFLNPFKLDLKCQNCQELLFPHPTDNFIKNEILDQCPICGCSKLHKQKDFNRKLGIFLILLGVAFSYFTYGLSLIIVTLTDWILYYKVKLVGVCYQCGGFYRDTKNINNLEPFNLTYYDHYRSRE